MRALILAVLIVFCLAGCATQGVSTINYTAGSQSTITNEKIIPKQQSAVWDELVRELSKSFYVINNIERESRIINVSFNSNSPSDYVDCGQTHRTFTQGDKTETFDYAVADRSTYKLSSQTQPDPRFSTYAVVNRVPTLEGRSNIYVAPEATNSDRTVVSVNTRYIVTIRVEGVAYVQNLAGYTLRTTPIPNQTSSFIFNTNKPSTTSEGGISFVCAGNGRLESEILRMIH